MNELDNIRVMNELDMISLKNLMLLSRNRDNEIFRWYVDGPEIKVVDPDNESYDTGNTCQNLEYPCLLMFHQLFRFLDESNRIRFKNYTQRDILNLMEHALESLFQLLNASDEPKEDKERLACLLSECDDKHSFHHELYYSESVCSRIGIWLSERFDMMIEGLSESHRYLYLTPMTMDLGHGNGDTTDTESDDSDEGSTDEENEDGEYEEPKKEC
jgi:hypothetical protein